MIVIMIEVKLNKVFAWSYLVLRYHYIFYNVLICPANLPRKLSTCIILIILPDQDTRKSMFN